MSSYLLSIVVPVYNEAENISRLLDEVEQNIHTSFEVLIVYDMEEDNTLPVVRSRQKTCCYQLKLVQNVYGRGVLGAIRSGFGASHGDGVLVVMADCSDDLRTVDRMCELIRNGADIVCGSRYIAGGEHQGRDVVKKTLSRVAGYTLHLFTRIPTRDVTNSFKMYRKRVLENIQIESKGGFEIGMELTAKAYAAGFSIVEIPSIWRERSVGASRFRLLAWLPQYLRWYFYLCFHVPLGFRLMRRNHAAT